MAKLYRVGGSAGPRYVIERGGVCRAVQGDIFGDFVEGDAISLEGLDIVAPVVPSKIIGIGLNYRDRAAERGKAVPAEPVIFIKPGTAAIGPGSPIRLPAIAGQVDHEAEAAVVIGRRAHRVPASRALECVLGLTCINDVTSRTLLGRDVQVTRCKGFDTFAPLGPCVALGLGAAAVTVEGYVNGRRRQSSSTADMVFSIEELVEFVSSVMTLLPGDVIATGTPAGVGPIVPGDSVTIRVGGVGALTNPVEQA